MIRALRSPTLGRQPFTLSVSNTTASPLQRCAAQPWRKNVGPKTASTRGIQTTARGNKAPGFAGWSTSAPFQPSRLTGKSIATSSKSKLFSRTQKRNFSWSWSRRSQANGGQAEETLSLSGRLKKLSREYGWSAVGVYFALSVLDFPFCFLLVKWVGTERIGEPLFHWPRPWPSIVLLLLTSLYGQLPLRSGSSLALNKQSPTASSNNGTTGAQQPRASRNTRSATVTSRKISRRLAGVLSELRRHTRQMRVSLWISHFCCERSFKLPCRLIALDSGICALQA